MKKYIKCVHENGKNFVVDVENFKEQLRQLIKEEIKEKLTIFDLSESYDIMYDNELIERIFK